MAVDRILNLFEKHFTDAFFDGNVIRVSAEELDVFFRSENSFSVKQVIRNISESVFSRDLSF